MAYRIFYLGIEVICFQADAAIALAEAIAAAERVPADDLAQEPIECPCCGCEACIGHEGDEIIDGQALQCGCKGHISCDSETEPWAVADDCGCQEINE